MPVSLFHIGVFIALSIRLPNDVEARRENLVAKTGGEGVITLLKQFVSVWMTSKIYISPSSGKTQTLPIEEVMKRHGWEG